MENISQLNTQQSRLLGLRLRFETNVHNMFRMSSKPHQVDEYNYYYYYDDDDIMYTRINYRELFLFHRPLTTNRNSIADCELRRSGTCFVIQE